MVGYTLKIVHVDMCKPADKMTSCPGLGQAWRAGKHLERTKTRLFFIFRLHRYHAGVDYDSVRLELLYETAVNRVLPDLNL